MLGLAIGLGVLGFFVAHRARRHGHGGCGRGGWHRGWPGAWAGHGHGAGEGWLRLVSARLDTTPAQERVIQRELGTLVERARDARRGAFGGKADLARAVRTSEFDASAAAAAFDAVTAATGDLRSAVIDSLRKIHEVLDDEQRQELGSLIDGGRWRFAGPAGGPYR
jgi:Spy/CpxP family protein refolding chaperone